MIDVTPEKALVFRITHVENVAWIVRHGVHARNSAQVDPDFREIGNPDLIDKRNRRTVAIPPGGTLSDYVPFYFTPYSPMLLNIKTGRGVQQTPMQDIAILVSSLPRLVELDIPFVFSDRHAYLATAQFSSELSDLDRIDWKLLQSRDFQRDPNDFGKVERYQAEALVYQSLPVEALLGIACYNAEREKRMVDLLKSAGKDVKVAVIPQWYF